MYKEKHNVVIKVSYKHWIEVIQQVIINAPNLISKIGT